VKGVVFREFFNMVEEQHSDELLDRIIVKADLPSGGAYTTSGTYPHEELVKVLVALSEEIQTPVPELLNAFGRYLVPVFKSKFPMLFRKHQDPLEFLSEVDGFVHVEVRKLYPEAELPRFICHRADPDLAHEHVRERDGGVPFHDQLVGAAGGQGVEAHGPVAALVGRGGFVLASDYDRDLFTGIGLAPDGVGLLLLQDHVVAEDVRELWIGLNGSNAECQRRREE
jgi:hypothetical protein